MKLLCDKKTNKNNMFSPLKPKLKRVAVVLCLTMLVLFNPYGQVNKPAYACCCWCVDNACIFQAHIDMQNELNAQHTQTRQLFLDELLQHQLWLITDLFYLYIQPMMNHMADQLTTVAMHQIFAIGTFFDAKVQLETQRLFDELRNETHRDYIPSPGMCMFGTTVRSIAAAEQRSDYSMRFIAKEIMDRQLGSPNSKGMNYDLDRESRLEQFKTKYCDVNDNHRLTGMAGTGLETLCTGGGGPQDRHNKDIDYFRTITFPETLELDFSDSTLTNDEEDVLALSAYLYGHKIPERIPDTLLTVEENQPAYMMVRSLIAKRSVAQNSFSAITALKTESPEREALPYMMTLLNELGLTDAEIQQIYGDNPSYLAQLEILGKKIYQRPNFYATLYDTPANVERKKVAMQAINMMIERELFKSQIRREALSSVLLEMDLMKYHDEVQNNISGLKRIEN